VTTICADTLLTVWAAAVWSAPTGLSSQTPGVNFSGLGTSNVIITFTALRSIVNAQDYRDIQGRTLGEIGGQGGGLLI
jgi:hypothetical protein